MSSNSVLNKKTTKQLLEILIYEKSKFESKEIQEIQQVFRTRGVLWAEEKELRKQLKKERRAAAKIEYEESWWSYSLWELCLEIVSLAARLFHS